MHGSDFNPIWELGSIPLSAAAAFSSESQPCPSHLLGSPTDYVRFEIPKFQRGLVWNKKKKQKLLQSLIQGWPTGAVVLTRIDSKEIASGQRELTWHVIDGQQRITTFLEFLKGFWSEPWYQITDELRSAFSALAETLDVENGSDVEVALILLTQGDASNPWSEEFLDESSTFLSKICRILSVDTPTSVQGPRYEKAIDACKIIRIGLQEQRKALNTVPIALITISPKQGIVAREARSISSQIFSVLNSGVPLNKYDLLAANWTPQLVPWEEYSREENSRSDARLALSTTQKRLMLEEMRSRIETSYKSFLEDVEDDAPIEGFGENEVSLFDYLYALSKSTSSFAIRESRGRIQTAERFSFPIGASSSTQAFDTCALLFSGSLSPAGIENLINTFPTYRGEYDIALVAEHYLEAAKEIDSKLAPYTQHATKNKKRASLGAIQASVYLASYLNSVFDTRLGEDDRLTIKKRSTDRSRTTSGNANLSHTQRLHNFRENLPCWWLIQTISDVFQGSDAYKQAFEKVWKRHETESLTGRVVFVEENDMILGQPELNDMLTAFRNLFIKEFRVSQAPTNRSPSQSAMALFSVVYKDKNQDMGSFDMDHVVAYRSQRNAPNSRLEKPIPLNHVGNFMPLLSNVNRSRGNAPWNQYFGTLDGANKETVKNDLLIDPSLFEEGLLNDLNSFGVLLLARYVKMIHKAMINVGLKDYLAKDKSQQLAVLLSTAEEIAHTLNLEYSSERFKSWITL
jgi:hypothetical protein